MEASDGADLYEGLDVRFVLGAKPTLVILERDSDAEKERVDLWPLDSVEAVHAVVRARGFLLARDDSTPTDRHALCKVWADKGECLANTAFMTAECARACARIEDRDPLCRTWAAHGECARNGAFMNASCPVACKDEL